MDIDYWGVLLLLENKWKCDLQSRVQNAKIQSDQDQDLEGLKSFISHQAL